MQDELNNLVGQNKTKVTGSTILKVLFNDTEHEYQVKSGKVTKYEKMDPTEVYAKLYTDGTLILSSYDYTDETKEISEDYGDVSNLYDYRINTDDVPRIYGECPGWFGSDGGYLSTPKDTKVIILDKIAPRNTAGWFYNIQSIEHIENLDTSNVIDMSWMFSCCKMSDIDLSNFNTSNVNNMFQMFYYSQNITCLDLSNFDTSNVINMGRMFYYCSSLTSLDLCNFDTSNVTTMSMMFNNCSSLTSLDLRNFDTSNVTNMAGLFDSCNSLTSLDLSNFDTSNVTTMNGMFNDCSSLITIYVSNKWSNECVTSSNDMFRDCSNLKGAISYDSSKTDVNYANYNTGYFTYKE